MIGARMDMRKFFFDSPRVMKAADATTRRIYAKFGFFVRRVARKSIKKARQKRLAEMGQDELRRYRIAQSIARRKGGRQPRRPLAASRPGEPPRSRTGRLKQGIFFAYEPNKRTVVIGPQAGGPRTADVLEYGGTTKLTTGPQRGKNVRVAARPYMGPAFAKEMPKLAGLWRDSIK